MERKIIQYFVNDGRGNVAGRLPSALVSFPMRETSKELIQTMGKFGRVSGRRGNPN